MPTIKLVPSFTWDCPGCSIENIVRVYDDDETPEGVCCKKCGKEYECEIDEDEAILATDEDEE